MIKLNKLKEFRIKNGLSQSELAKEIGVTVRYIAFIEAGQRTPSLTIGIQIARFFNVHVEDIFFS